MRSLWFRSWAKPISRQPLYALSLTPFLGNAADGSALTSKVCACYNCLAFSAAACASTLLQHLRLRFWLDACTLLLRDLKTTRSGEIQLLFRYSIFDDKPAVFEANVVHLVQSFGHPDIKEQEMRLDFRLRGKPSIRRSAKH